MFSVYGIYDTFIIFNNFIILLEVKFTLHNVNHLCMIQWHVAVKLLHKHQLCQFQSIFITTKGDPVSIKQSLFIFPLIQTLETTNMISVARDLLFWRVHTIGITKYVTFCVWLLSRSIMSSRFI